MKLAVSIQAVETFLGLSKDIDSGQIKLPGIHMGLNFLHHQLTGPICVSGGPYLGFIMIKFRSI